MTERCQWPPHCAHPSHTVCAGHPSTAWLSPGLASGPFLCKTTLCYHLLTDVMGMEVTGDSQRPTAQAHLPEPRWAQDMTCSEPPKALVAWLGLAVKVPTITTGLGVIRGPLHGPGVSRRPL